jgi:hypothetical protein
MIMTSMAIVVVVVAGGMIMAVIMLMVVGVPMAMAMIMTGMPVVSETGHSDQIDSQAKAAHHK